ncbi:hypothetical protein GCM10010435_39520 [Winogradskya consettensis]|uniref:Barstar (barnase inhibitor) domain-containing protein n=1 Tax=Winogradskya consettensis TaxID=113560 RepID=A0A919SD00_9ACTN|nr:barstar family protein [Actinoplanes consettensis]GIM69531.1 hypothetical protein Aco04nite_15650 [Actinoplanes consettensis]
MTRYALRLGTSHDNLVVAERVEHFFTGRYSMDDMGLLLDEPHAVMTFHLAGLSGPATPAQVTGDIEVLILDSRSAVMGRYPFWNASAIPASGGSWAVTATSGVLPQVSAERWWHRWAAGPITRKGQWESDPVGQREGWVEVISLRADEGLRPPVVAGATPYILDGHAVRDVASFFCAAGEAFAGPGGYAGECWTAWEEFLAALPGPKPVDLLWTDYAVAARSLPVAVDPADPETTRLDLIIASLNRHGVTVIPA